MSDKQEKQPSGEQKSTRDPKELVRRRRKLHRSGKLQVPLEQRDADFMYRWAIDSGDRSNIQRYLDYGYTIEDKKLDVGDGSVIEGSSHGSTTNIKAGGGGRLVLMKIHKDLYKVGLEEKALECDAIEKSMRVPEGMDPKLTTLTQQNKTE